MVIGLAFIPGRGGGTCQSSQRAQDGDEWAPQWHVEHSTMLPNLKMKRVQERTLVLVLETLRMELVRQ